MKTILASLLALFVISTNTAHAEEGHTLGTITGTHNVDLKEFDHSVAGSVKDFTIFGNVSESSNSAELIMKKDGQLIKANFEQVGKIISGKFEHQVEDMVFVTDITFKGIKKDTTEFIYEVNGQTVNVSVKYDRIENNHFINPEYSFTYNNETYTYKFNNGAACYRYTALLSFIMISALTH